MFLIYEKRLSVIVKLSNYMSFEKRKILLNGFVESLFGYCPLTCIIGEFKNKSYYKRALRIVYKNNTVSCEELLKLDSSFRIHHRNIQSLAIEL